MNLDGAASLFVLGFLVFCFIPSLYHSSQVGLESKIWGSCY